jgi:glutathione S-transferase
VIPRLTYFDMRGRAEAIRVFLHATGIEFEDKRIVSPDEWTALGRTLPFGVLPIYEEPPDMRLAESQAILRHLGRRLGRIAQTDLDLAYLDVAQEAIADSQENLWRFNWGNDYYRRLESYAQETLRPRLQRLERWLTRGSRIPEWLGDRFSHVDCLAFCYLDEVDAFFPVVLADFAKLADLRMRVASLPGVCAYLRSDSRPIVFGMGRMGPKVDPRTSVAPGFIYANPWSQGIDLGEVVLRQRRLTR